jgi:hypothetical protein
MTHSGHLAPFQTEPADASLKAVARSRQTNDRRTFAWPSQKEASLMAFWTFDLPNEGAAYGTKRV